MGGATDSAKINKSPEVESSSGLFKMNASKTIDAMVMCTWIGALALILYTLKFQLTLSKLMTVVLSIGCLWIAYAIWVFFQWEEQFSMQRVTRRDENCPSNKLPPDVKSWQENKAKTLENSRKHKCFDTCELLHPLADLEVVKRENDLIRQKAREMRTNSLTPGFLSKKDIGSLSTEQASELNMDHIYVRFSHFLWAYTFIGPSSYLLWKMGVTYLSIKQYLVKLGIMKVDPVDIEALIGTLCLEQTQAIHYYARTKPDSELGDVAGFFFADFPYIDSNCKKQVADLLAVDIDLKTKKFLKAKMDDVNLTASETLILLWFNTIAAQHVKLHALANWGVNVEDVVRETNPFLHRNSVVTTMYNFFGYSKFKTFMEGWERMGLLQKGHDPNALIDCFNHGIEDNIWQHSKIDELIPHSRFINFVVRVRKIFLSEFEKHKDLFPGVHVEAMFVGTVLHSLDHTLMDWNLTDPLWLDVDDPKFGIMAQIGRIVKVGFVKDVPLLYFHKRFKGSGHPFYEAVYAKAARIDKDLADNMDTCIIK